VKLQLQSTLFLCRRCMSFVDIQFRVYKAVGSIGDNVSVWSRSVARRARVRVCRCERMWCESVSQRRHLHWSHQRIRVLVHGQIHWPQLPTTYISLSLSLSLSRPGLNPNTLLPRSGSIMCVYVCQSVPPVCGIVNRQITTWDFVYVILNMWLNSNIQLTSYLLGLNKLN